LENLGFNLREKIHPKYPALTIYPETGQKIS